MGMCDHQTDYAAVAESTEHGPFETDLGHERDDVVRHVGIMEFGYRAAATVSPRIQQMDREMILQMEHGLLENRMILPVSMQHYKVGTASHPLVVQFHSIHFDEHPYRTGNPKESVLWFRRIWTIRYNRELCNTNRLIFQNQSSHGLRVYGKAGFMGTGACE